MTNLKCPFNHELLSTYASGNGSPQDRSVVERHLANCVHCRKEVLELEKSWWALDVWRDQDISVHPRFDLLKSRIETSYEPVSLIQRAKPYVHQANQWFAKSSKFAAAAALAAFMAAAVFQGGQSTGSNPGMAAQLADAKKPFVQTGPKLVEFADPIDDALKENLDDVERLQTFVAFGDRSRELASLDGYTPRSVVPASNNMVTITFQPSAMSDGVYLGQ